MIQTLLILPLDPFAKNIFIIYAHCPHELLTKIWASLSL